jgi:hypothetical protein
MQAFEWDVQLSRTGKAQLGWLSRAGDMAHINVSLDGEMTHQEEGVAEGFPEVSLIRDVTRSAKKGMLGAVIGRSENPKALGNVMHAVMLDETGRVVAISESDLRFTGNVRSCDEIY